MPPETGNSGSGVITRTAAAALKCCPTVTWFRNRQKQQNTMALTFMLKWVYILKLNRNRGMIPTVPVLNTHLKTNMTTTACRFLAKAIV
ncbi:hypothetical protein D3C87_1915810 [compost metagenome]